jgi:hypothetical protein
LSSGFEGTRINRIPDLDVDAYSVRLSQRAQAEFARYRDQYARRYPTRFSREAATGVNVIFGRNPDPVRHRHLEAVPMSHPLARFASKHLEDRQQGSPPRPATAFMVPRADALGLAPGDYVIGLERWCIKGVLPVDKLAFVGARIADHAAIDSDTAERLLMEGLARHPQLLRADDSVIAEAMEGLARAVLPALAAARNAFEEGEAARHYDLAETQRALIIENRRRRQQQAEQRIRDLRLTGGEGRMRIAYLEEAKLQKFLARIDLKLEDIQRREQTFSVAEPVLIGVALVRVEV